MGSIGDAMVRIPARLHSCGPVVVLVGMHTYYGKQTQAFLERPPG